MATIRYGSTATGHLVWGASQPLQAVDLNAPVPPPIVKPPKATIRDWNPKSGIVPFVSTAFWERDPTSGPITTVQWLLNGQVVAPNNSPSDPDHHYKITMPGDHRIDLRVIGPGGTDQTGKLRIIHATSPVNPPEPPEPLPPGTFPGRLSTQGTTFRTPEGAIWKWHGVTAFTALQDWIAGRQAKLTTYAQWTRSIGAYVWRVFGIWVVTEFKPENPAYYTGLSDLAEWLQEQGIYLHFVPFCDQTSSSSVLLSPAQQDDHLSHCTVALAPHDNVLMEYVNEDWKNGSIAHRFGRVGNFKITRSAFEDGKSYTQPGPLMDFTTEHTPRASVFPNTGGECKSWTRKAKNPLETSRQGMGTIAPPSGVPAICGEPIGIWEQNQSGRRTNDPKAIADYFATLELFCAGGNLHGDMSNLMTCVPPGPIAQQCAEAVRDVWSCGIAADAAPTGQYTRGGLSDCPLVHHDRYADNGTEIDTSGALRTFGMIQGNQATCVVVQAGPDWELRTVSPWVVRRQGGPQGQVLWLQR